MNIEQHVPKLETCQKLQEAGWKSHGFNHWVYDDYEKEWIVVCCQSMDSGRKIEWYPAPLLSELLEVLPSGIVVDKKDGEWFIMRRRHTAQKWRGDNPAEAAAQLVLTLVDEGVLTL